MLRWNCVSFRIDFASYPVVTIWLRVLFKCFVHSFVPSREQIYENEDSELTRRAMVGWKYHSLRVWILFEWTGNYSDHRVSISVIKYLHFRWFATVAFRCNLWQNVPFYRPMIHQIITILGNRNPPISPVFYSNFACLHFTIIKHKLCDHWLLDVCSISKKIHCN